MITDIVNTGLKILDKVIPDPAAKAAAQLELIKLQQNGALSAIVADAQSADPWTSRARPSFLYVVYVIILWSLPMGVLSIFNPAAAQSFTLGFQNWLAAIPEPIIALFGTVMTGYVLGRSWEKVKGGK